MTPQQIGLAAHKGPLQVPCRAPCDAVESAKTFLGRKFKSRCNLRGIRAPFRSVLSAKGSESRLKRSPASPRPHLPQHEPLGTVAAPPGGSQALLPDRPVAACPRDDCRVLIRVRYVHHAACCFCTRRYSATASQNTSSSYHPTTLLWRPNLAT